MIESQLAFKYVLPSNVVLAWRSYCLQVKGSQKGGNELCTVAIREYLERQGVTIPEKIPHGLALDKIVTIGKSACCGGCGVHPEKKGAKEKP